MTHPGADRVTVSVRASYVETLSMTSGKVTYYSIHTCCYNKNKAYFHVNDQSHRICRDSEQTAWRAPGCVISCLQRVARKPHRVRDLRTETVAFYLAAQSSEAWLTFLGKEEINSALCEIYGLINLVKISVPNTDFLICKGGCGTALKAELDYNICCVCMCFKCLRMRHVIRKRFKNIEMYSKGSTGDCAESSRWLTPVPR